MDAFLRRGRYDREAIRRRVPVVPGESNVVWNAGRGVARWPPMVGERSAVSTGARPV